MEAGSVARPCVLIIGTGTMGARVAAWLLVLGEEVRVWTTTSRSHPHVESACNHARAEIRMAMDCEESTGYSMSAAMAAAEVAKGDPELLNAMPFVVGRSGERPSRIAKRELWERLSVEANDGRPRQPDNRSAQNVWLAIDCTRDPETPQQKIEAMQRAASLLTKVHEASPDAVLAIKHEGVDFRDLQNACKLPVLCLRFLKPVFFMPFVELQGTDETATSRVAVWLAGLHLMPFTSAARVRMMQSRDVDSKTSWLMRTYARRHFGGVASESNECCVCLSEKAEVMNATCGHAVFCRACASECSRLSTCPMCRAPWDHQRAMSIL